MAVFGSAVFASHVPKLAVCSQVFLFLGLRGDLNIPGSSLICAAAPLSVH